MKVIVLSYQGSSHLSRELDAEMIVKDATSHGFHVNIKKEEKEAITKEEEE